MKYKESLEDVDNFGELQCKILMTHANTLRGKMEHMEVQWDSLQDGIPQDNYNQIKAIIKESMDAAETALQGAESFVCHAAQQVTSMAHGTKSEDANSLALTPDSSLLGTASGKPERLENTLHPIVNLSRTMTLEVASTWLKKFDSYLEWNKAVISKKSPKQLKISWRAFLTRAWCPKCKQTTR